MQHLSTADLLLQVRLVPETRHRYEFPYSTQMPAYLQLPSNPFTQSLFYEWNERDSADPTSTRSLSNTSANERYQDQYLKPYHAATIVDTRIHDVVPSRWTNVKADDGFMRQLLHAYLLQEYDWFSFFVKDYFLDDMLSGSVNFCSRLLVNVVLAVGCVSFNIPVAFWCRSNSPSFPNTVFAYLPI